MPLSKIQPEWENELKSVLNDAGFIQIQHVANTLQGAIYKALQISTDTKVIIKATQKFLHNNSSTIINNKLYKISENILQESIMLKTVTKDKSAPKTIVKFIDLLQCDYNYYLVQEFGGSSLFEFIVRGHLLMAKGHITIESWTNVVKIIFKQMTDCIEYIHSKGIAHFDVSLENFLINDVQVNVLQNPENPKKYKVIFDLDNIQIKLIDFGLAQAFQNDIFLTEKKCGKPNYKSPEIKMGRKRIFNAKSNDIWCSGICLFMGLFGVHPWMHANSNDRAFNYVFKHNGNISKLLKKINKYHYIKKNKDVIDLFQSIFQFEEERISIKNIRNHPWLKY